MSTDAATKRYGGFTPEELRARRRRRLLDTAQALFAERGYRNTSIEFLCSQARVTTRHFYEHFSGREALLSNVLDEVIGEAENRARQALDNQERSMGRRVGDAIRAAMLYLLEDPRRARIACLECVGISQAMEQQRRMLLHGFAALVQGYGEELARSGILPQRDYHLAAVALIGAVMELIQEWLETDTGLDAEGLAREAVLHFRALIVGARHYEEDFDGGVSSV